MDPVLQKSFVVGAAYLCSFIFVISSIALLGKWKHDPIFTKRNPTLLFAVLIIAAIDSLVTGPMYRASVLGVLQVSNQRQLAPTIGNSVSWVIVFLTFYIFYHMFYDLMVSCQISQQSWQEKLRPQNPSRMQMYKSTLGKPSWTVTRIVLPFFVVWSSMTILTSFTSPLLFLIFQYTMILLVTIGWITLACNFSKTIRDRWGMRKQFVYLLTVTIGMATLGTIIQLIEYFTKSIGTWMIVVVALLTVLWLDACLYVMIWYPIVREYGTIRPLVDSPRPGASLRRLSSDSRNIRLFLGTVDIFEDDQLFNDYMTYAMQELSFENVLFLVEVSQFKQLLRTEDVGSELSEARRWEFNFPDYVPALYAKDNLEPLAVLARNIFMKYVSVHAEMEINVSSDVRMKLYECFERQNTPSIGWSRDDDDNSQCDINDMPVREMFEVFDDAAQQIGRLVGNSVLRFQANL